MLGMEVGRRSTMGPMRACEMPCGFVGHASVAQAVLLRGAPSRCFVSDARPLREVARLSCRSTARHARTGQPATAVAMNVENFSTSSPAQKEPVSVLGALFNLTLFASYFGALMAIVRRAALEATLPHERIILVALAVILPDLARFSFTSLTDSPRALQKARNPQHVEEDGFPRHYASCLVSTGVKLAGFVVAAVSRVTIGAFLVVLGQLIVNSMVQLRVVNGTIFKLRRQDRTGVILLELLSLAMLACASFGQFPIMSSALFLSLVTVYWLAKYDVDLFGGQ